MIHVKAFMLIYVRHESENMIFICSFTIQILCVIYPSHSTESPTLLSNHFLTNVLYTLLISIQQAFFLIKSCFPASVQSI
ncbi:uncharacterized protein EV154DRAFT_493945 [Mucor mucedo]|uniref:uncharacterized protein n=1 Tax=Mucor mucedo TaxID=29922 RepID=UPI0022208051|nr:uncharacterized protein EV154DRAFT_493945 [Mucor mucedo]KAI7895850.1 hypothetical protein EV154DRAFT_493945 [Mucor mucedo]